MKAHWIRPLAAAGVFAVLTTPAQIALGAGGVRAGFPEDVMAYDSREIAMLPNYCIYSYSFRESGYPGANDPAEYERWKQIIGPMFGAIHHYCVGIMKTNRALVIATDQTTRRFYLTSAISEFDYVIVRSPADFVLLPEILTKKGENLLRLDKDHEAITVLERSIQLNPEFVPPYGILSDYYKGKGDRAKAIEVAKRGLSAVPDAALLKSRIDALEAAASRKR